MDQFIIKFRDAIMIEGEELPLITSDTKFQELEVWDSMNALNVLMLFDAEYGVEIEPKKMLACETVSELYLLIGEK